MTETLESILNLIPADSETKKFLESLDCPIEVRLAKKGECGEYHVKESHIIGKKPKRSKWHRVEDKLPDTTRLVLTWDGDNHRIGYYASHTWWRGCTIVLLDITHWRELPKPPKDDC